MTLTIPRPINAHGHLRQDGFAKALALYASKFYAWYLQMPNLQPSVLTGDQALKYQRLTQDAAKGKMGIIPTIKITEETTPDMVTDAYSKGVKFAKVYPLGRTTHADDGVATYYKLWPVFLKMEELGMTALFHPTHPSKSYNNREAEYAFAVLFRTIKEAFPRLRMTWEHLSDARCIPLLKALQNEYDGVFVTITAHHMFGTEDAHFGDVSATCQPPIRTEWDRTELNRFVMEDNDWVMAGLDDAPHKIEKKHVVGCCACGAYTTQAGTLLYASTLYKAGLFFRDDGSDIFVRFVSSNAATYFDVPESTELVEIVATPWTIPKEYRFGENRVLPYGGGLELPFSYKDKTLLLPPES